MWKSCALMKPPSRMLTSWPLIVAIAVAAGHRERRFVRRRASRLSAIALACCDRDVQQLVLVRHDHVAVQQVAELARLSIALVPTLAIAAAVKPSRQERAAGRRSALPAAAISAARRAM